MFDHWYSILHWLSMHPVAHAHFHMMRYYLYPHKMEALLHQHHYKVWLDHYLHWHHRLPGDDLLLGS